ncbi:MULTISPECIES: hypothetical protein [Pseudomonas syringae group]|uniref:Uncharacterized protein n=1 Tax=Pseudomonas meliae TaxID=86176 RepID=A0A0P9TXT2_9PSED|nr:MULTISPECIES: hypothetical protein [Pseudomonas syringae group]KPX80283.1 Unknown protein sequence [Pseudomonas meliae]RXU06375.1 hypothetical protein B1F68_12670 [Pseudomonas syringae]
MSDSHNTPSIQDCPTVIGDARHAIDRRAWTIKDGHDLATHLQAVRTELGAYLADLDQRKLISVTVLNYLRTLLDVELEKVEEAESADDADQESIRRKQPSGIGMERAVPLDIDESCVELVKRFQDLDRRVHDMIFGPPGYDMAVLEALETERANVVNSTMFRLGVALRACGYLHD